MDKNGESLNRNPLIAVISSIILEEKPGTTIVTDSTTSGHLQAFIEAKAGNNTDLNVVIVMLSMKHCA